MLRLAGGRHSLPQSQDRTDSWPNALSPTHILCVYTRMHTLLHFFHDQACNQSAQLFDWSRWQFDFNQRSRDFKQSNRNSERLHPPSAAAFTFWQLKAFSSLENSSVFHLKHKWISPKKCLWLQISSCQRVEISLSTVACFFIPKYDFICISSGVTLDLLWNGTANSVLSLFNCNRKLPERDRHDVQASRQQTRCLPWWMSFISRCRLDIRMPTAWDRFASSSLISWKKEIKTIHFGKSNNTVYIFNEYYLNFITVLYPTTSWPHSTTFRHSSSILLFKRCQ